jgi:hypothetical protein
MSEPPSSLCPAVTTISTLLPTPMDRNSGMPTPSSLSSSTRTLPPACLLPTSSSLKKHDKQQMMHQSDRKRRMGQGKGNRNMTKRRTVDIRHINNRRLNVGARPETPAPSDIATNIMSSVPTPYGNVIPDLDDDDDDDDDGHDNKDGMRMMTMAKSANTMVPKKEGGSKQTGGSKNKGNSKRKGGVDRTKKVNKMKKRVLQTNDNILPSYDPRRLKVGPRPSSAPSDISSDIMSMVPTPSNNAGPEQPDDSDTNKNGMMNTNVPKTMRMGTRRTIQRTSNRDEHPHNHILNGSRMKKRLLQTNDNILPIHDPRRLKVGPRPSSAPSDISSDIMSMVPTPSDNAVPEPDMNNHNKNGMMNTNVPKTTMMGTRRTTQRTSNHDEHPYNRILKVGDRPTMLPTSSGSDDGSVECVEL